MFYPTEKNNNALIKVQEIKNYGFKILYANSNDPIISQGWINSKPNIFINGTTCYVDYSHVYDISDRTYLNRTFGSLVAGNTFRINDSQYYDSDKSINTIVGGTCTFSSTLNEGRIIVGSIVSGLNGLTNYCYFSKENFVDTPQYSFVTNGLTGYYYMLNTLPYSSTNSFVKMGMLGSSYGTEEYVDVSGGTNENATRIKVNSVATLKDNQEILYFASGGTAQDFSTTNTTVSLYLRGEAAKANYNYSPRSLGIFVITDENNNVTDCFENQNGNQSIFRKTSLGATYTGTYYACNKCFDKIYGNVGNFELAPIFLPFTNMIFPLIESSTTNGIQTYGLYVYRDGAATSTGVLNPNSNKVKISEFSLPSTAQNLKIDLSHPSLLGYTLEIYYDEAKTIIASTNIDIYGNPGFNTSFAFIKKGFASLSLYCTLKGQYTIDFIIRFT